MDKEIAEKFSTNYIIKRFLKEQNYTDDYLFLACKQLDDDFLKLSELKTMGGRISKSKVIAFLYQHYETKAMTAAHSVIVNLGATIIAKVHDAVFIDRKLSLDNRQIVEAEMRIATGLEYWKFDCKEIKRYERPYSMDAEEISAHRKRIAEEERRAKEVFKNTEYSSFVCELDSHQKTTTGMTNTDFLEKFYKQSNEGLGYLLGTN